MTTEMDWSQEWAHHKEETPAPVAWALRLLEGSGLGEDDLASFHIDTAHSLDATLSQMCPRISALELLCREAHTGLEEHVEVCGGQVALSCGRDEALMELRHVPLPHRTQPWHRLFDLLMAGEILME